MKVRGRVMVEEGRDVPAPSMDFLASSSLSFGLSKINYAELTTTVDSITHYNPIEIHMVKW